MVWSRHYSTNPSTYRSCPKSTSGGKSTVPHFKVNLMGRDGSREVSHEHLIKIDHQDKNGHTRRYQMNTKPVGYDYATLRAKNGPPSGCPRNKRLQREREAAERAKEA